ncbi:MAG: xanthine dehydrogenase family protein molybdopterin-binding subunit [Candidatus Bipolaricaulota bacterium]
MPELRVVGRPVLRDDAIEKVTGTARYTTDLALPGMLYAAILTSPHASARIARIDVATARGEPGVRAVLTGDDLDVLLGLYLRDKRILARGVVRYQGEPVAAVAADTLDEARSALRKIRVDYEELPAVFDARAAMAPGAPRVHPELATYERMRGVFFPEAGTNVAHHQKIRRGDAAAALDAADVRIEATFDNPPVQHVPLETHAAIAQALPADRVEVWTSSQSPYTVRHLLAHAFGLPHASVRVHVPYVGGGFGGKAGLGVEPLAYVLSKACGGRPVLVSMTREQEFNTMPSRQGLTSTLRLGATRDGRLTALEATYVWDAGAYADYGVNIGRAAAYAGAGPYAVDNCSIDSYVVYTNKVYGTAFRGFGHLEVLWGVERAIDRLARALDLDPVEFRRRNLLRSGDTTITGEPIAVGHGSPRKCLEAVAQAIGWGLPPLPPDAPNKVRGKGVAMLHKAPAMPTNTSCAAVIKLDEDGAADLLVSGVDYGQGTYTVLRQIAAEELSLPIEKVHAVWDCDTAMTPYDWQTVASRFAYMGGNAVIAAAADCRRQLIDTAANALGVPAEALVCRDGRVCVASDEGRGLEYRQLALGFTFPNGNAIGGPIIGHGRSIATGLTNLDPETGQGRPAQFWTYGAHAVEIEVDTETGEITVLRLVTAVDAGKVLNPLLCRGQIVGGVVQGLGSALLEGFQFDERGRLMNPSFVDYKIATAKDLPREIVPIMIENPQPDGPYGARGVAEHPMISVPSALGNALFDALGIDFSSLPLTPERVLGKILEAGSR